MTKETPDKTHVHALLKSYAMSNGYLDNCDSISRAMNMAREHILSQHNHNISQRKGDMRWQTKIGSHKPYKKLVRVNKEDLINDLLLYYLDTTPTLTFEECFEAYLDSVENSENPPIKPKTVNTYRGEYNRFLAGKPVCNQKIALITANDIRKTLDAVINTKDKITNRRLYAVKTIIGHAFKYARFEEQIDVIPIMEIMREIRYNDNQLVSSADISPKKKYSLNDIGILQEHLEDKGDLISLGILLTLCTGLRISEIAALKWEDINPEYLHICNAEHSWTDKNRVRQVKICLPKKGKIRDVSLSTEANEIIKKLKSSVPFHSDDDFVIKKDDQRVTTRMFDYYLRKNCEECGITILSMHKLRMFYSTILHMQGVPTVQIQHQLGHSDIATTEKYYIKDILSENERNILIKKTSIFSFCNVA